MIIYVQDIGYHLCDPEIANQTIVEEESDESKMLVEYIFLCG